MIRNEWTDVRGVVTAEVIDLDARTVTIEVDGDVQSSRSLTDVEVRQIVVATNPAPDLTAVIAAKLVAQANAEPPVHAIPQGAHDAWLPGQIVLHPETGNRWRNEHTGVNPWPLEERYYWRNLDYVEPVGAQPWVPWPGHGPLYQVDAEVTHKGRLWRSTTPNNHWEPSVFGWADIGPD